MKNILIHGASGHSKMIVDIILKRKNYNIIGFIDSFKDIGTNIYGYKVIGKPDRIPELIKNHDIFGIVIGIGDNYNRQNAYKKIHKIAPTLEFISVIHPSAILAHDIKIPNGTIVMAGVVINADAKVGKFCILNTKSSLGHDSTLADFSSLASGVTVGGNVDIGHNTAICLQATIIQSVSIGNHTIVGAASLVLNSIGDYKLVYGNPVNHIEDREHNSKYLG